jgi:hypothetical protein
VKEKSVSNKNAAAIRNILKGSKNEDSTENIQCTYSPSDIAAFGLRSKTAGALSQQPFNERR